MYKAPFIVTEHKHHIFFVICLSSRGFVTIFGVALKSPRDIPQNAGYKLRQILIGPAGYRPIGLVTKHYSCYTSPALNKHTTVFLTAVLNNNLQQFN